MSVKISELPNFTAANIVADPNSYFPLVSDITSADTTFKTTVANVKTYIESANVNLTGAIFANLTSEMNNLVIRGNLNVVGTTTTTSSENLSTNSSILDLHTFNSNLAPWTSDDGRDIGLRMFYYKASGGANSAALVWENTTQYLTYYGSGAGNSNAGTISGTLGTMQVGQMIISNSTATSANATGALQVGGGISTGGNIWVVGRANIGSTLNAGAATLTSLTTGTGNATVGNLSATTGVSGATAQFTSFGTIGTTLVVGGNITTNGLTVNTSTTIGSTLSAGSIQNTAIGNVSRASGAFTTLSAAGGLNSTVIGNTTAASGRFTQINTTANATIASNLSVGDYLIVTGTTTFNNDIFTQNIRPLANATYNIGSVTEQFVNVYAYSTRAVYADLAEYYVPDQMYEPGTVVIFGGEKEITTTDKREDTRVAGAISTEPAYVMNSGQTDGLPVALRGKIPVKIIGPVNKGDLLVSSEVPGHGQAARFTAPHANAVFAKSLVNDYNSGPRTIWAVIV